MAQQNQTPLTDMEKGLLKHKSRMESHLNGVQRKLDIRTKFIIDLLKDDHKKLKEFYVIGDYWMKGYVMTELKEYTNKKGKKTMKHYVGKHYWTKQPKEEEPTLVYGWSIQITEETVELYDIDNKGNLIANKDKFQRYYDSM